MARVGVAALLMACGSSQLPAVENGSSAGAPLFSPGEVIEYAIEASDGRVLGRAHSRYDEAGANRVVVTRVALPHRTVEYATTLANDLSPLAFKRLSSTDGRMTLSFEPNGITRVTDLGTDRLQAAKADLVPTDDLILLALALRRANLAPGQSARLSVLLPDAAEPLEWPVQVYSDPQRRTIVQLPLAKATLTPRGQIAELIASDGRKLRRVDAPGEPPPLLPIPVRQDYVRPAQASWIDEELVIPVEGGQLAGVVSMPRLRSRWKKNAVPAIVFVSDLPQQSRHGFTAGADYGTWQIFDHLAEQGFAVLRVDDRGVGASQSAIAPEQVTVETQVADAIAMIEAVRKRAGVDAEKIFLVGHGWGGVEALMTAKVQELAGVVLIGPPLRSAEKVLAERAAALLGRPPSAAELEELHLPFAARAKGHASLEVGSLVPGVEEPIAIFQGFKDFEVSWREDAKPLSEAFAKKQAKLFVYEHVDHLMKQESGASSPARYADAGRKVDAAVLDDLTGWLVEKAL
jgi:pimeloyl-ACP methyl ester carboxylesterase